MTWSVSKNRTQFICTSSTKVDRSNISSRRLWSFDPIPCTKLSIRTLPRKKHVPLNCFFFIDSVTKLISYCIARFIRNPFLYALSHIIRSEYSTVQLMLMVILLLCRLLEFMSVCTIPPAMPPVEGKNGISVWSEKYWIHIFIEYCLFKFSTLRPIRDWTMNLKITCDRV